MTPSGGSIGIGEDGNLDAYSGYTGPLNFGTGGNTLTLDVSGNTFLFGAALYGLGVPAGYVSGTALSNTATWNNASIASLGAANGTYVWTWGNGAEQSFTLEIVSPAAVPEPAALSLFGFGVLLIGAFAACVGTPHRRRCKAGLYRTTSGDEGCPFQHERVV